MIDSLFEFRELHNEDIFMNFVVQKRDFDVHLLDFSIVNDDYDVHCFIIHWFDHRDENLRIIQSFNLLEITNHSSRFITQNFVMFISFDFVNSFIAKYSSIFKKNWSTFRSHWSKEICFRSSWFSIIRLDLNRLSFFLYDQNFKICWKSMTFFMYLIINKFKESKKSKW